MSTEHQDGVVLHWIVETLHHWSCFGPGMELWLCVGWNDANHFSCLLQQLKVKPVLLSLNHHGCCAVWQSALVTTEQPSAASALLQQKSSGVDLLVAQLSWHPCNCAALGSCCCTFAQGRSGMMSDRLCLLGLISIFWKTSILELSKSCHFTLSFLGATEHPVCTVKLPRSAELALRSSSCTSQTKCVHVLRKS